MNNGLVWLERPLSPAIRRQRQSGLQSDDRETQSQKTEQNKESKWKFLPKSKTAQAGSILGSVGSGQGTNIRPHTSEYEEEGDTEAYDALPVAGTSTG